MVSRLVGHRSVVVAQPGRPTSIAVALLLTVIQQVATIVLAVMADSILNIEIQLAEDILSSVGPSGGHRSTKQDSSYSTRCVPPSSRKH